MVSPTGQSVRTCVLIRRRVRRTVIARAPPSPSAEIAMAAAAPMPASPRSKPLAVAVRTATDPEPGPERAPMQSSSRTMGRYEDEHRSARGRRACAVGAATAPSASTTATLEAMREWMMVMRPPFAWV